MAGAQGDVCKLEMSLVEKLYVQKALQMLKQSLKRSVANEVPGSEISALRGKEIQSLDSLINRLG